MEKRISIIGAMGPMAKVELFRIYGVAVQRKDVFFGFFESRCTEILARVAIVKAGYCLIMGEAHEQTCLSS